MREKLGQIIQSGGGSGALGHSSLEDAKATLDLVRWYILHQEDRSRATKPQSETSDKKDKGNAPQIVSR